jgi:hypothetical protein
MAGLPPFDPGKKRSELPDPIPLSVYLRKRSGELIARARNARQIVKLGKHVTELYERRGTDS